VLFKLVVDKRLEQLERHFLRKPALMQLEFRTDDDNRTSRIIDTLSEQVLTKTSLLTFKSSRQRLERAIVRTAKYAAAPAIVEQRIDSFLQHAFFISNDHFRCPQLDQLFQTVVAVDHTAIKIVKIRRRKAAAVERHKRTKLRRNDRDHIED